MPDAANMVRRLVAALDEHDLEALVDCFHVDYRNETPAHPARGFVGRDQVRRNWSRLFEGMPDLTGKMLRLAVDGDTVWSEWEMRGTRRDRSRHLMRGVIVFGVEADRARWARFYLETVDDETSGVDEAVQQAVSGPS